MAVDLGVVVLDKLAPLVGLGVDLDDREDRDDLSLEDLHRFFLAGVVRF